MAVSPIVLGHEFSGDVVALGPEVTTVSKGDRVTADINISCGTCYFCLRNQKLLCKSIRQIGVHVDGAFAQFVGVPAQSIRMLPPSMTYREGSIVEPLACVIHGQERARVGVGCTVAVLGAGPIGLLHAMTAHASGVTSLVVGEISEFRLAKVRESGLARVIDARTADLVSEVLDATDGIGADVVIEAVGSLPVLEQALKMVRPGGTLLVFGGHAEDTVLGVRPFDIYHNEITIIGSYAGSYNTWPQAIALIGSSRVQTAPLITHLLSLEEIPGFLQSSDQASALMKALWVDDSPVEACV